METSLLDSDFPPLSSSGAATLASLRNWNQIFALDTSSAPKVFSFSHHPSEPDIIPFSNEKLTMGGEDWNLCLIGYSIGRRPFYEALLGAINKTWSLKGSLQLLSLSDGFFLLRFSCVEDFDMAWSKVPIWVKIHDLPLACWNSEGISRIASKISVPLAADHLTEQKTRLTFARVCVLADCNAAYPDVIKVSLDGDVVELKVQYEWKPVPCEHCDIKNQDWANANYLNLQLDYLHAKQQDILDLLMVNPLDGSLGASLKDINLEFSDVSSKQASWIIQRAKLNWLQHGEDDLKFLYGKIRSRIGSSKPLVNLFSSNPSIAKEDVIKSITSHFQDLFNRIPPSGRNLDSFPICAPIPEFYSNQLVSPILDDEIKAAVFKGSSKSSPEPDCFNYHFYKSAWHIIGPLVCKAIRFFFLKGYLPSGIKATALAIIPKHRNDASISDYRPVSLCNTLYKIIAKIIAGRMNPIMPLIVKDTQADLVKARISIDSILLANDILSLVNKGGVGNIFCAKLDIKKAFDSVSREFLLACMLQKGFPKPFISWIKAYITNVNFSIIIDGALEGLFSSSAGLRQGCPLSPYLFCLVMDALSNLLDERGFKGFKTDNYHLSHLLYADDVLILGDATIDNCKILSSILTDFANATGLHINYDKCFIMFSENQRNQDMLCQALSITNVSSKLTYLGIPISFTRLKVEDCLPLMDKLHRKFTGWKANLLSFAGRLQYLKFTIQNTIAYWIRGSILPKTVFKFFKKTCSKFLFFGDITSLNKLHMVSWDTVCLPKQKGGLGITSIAALQFAFNCSVIQRMYNCPSPLSTWLSAQYISPWKPTTPKDSKFWINVCKTAASIKMKFKFVITPNAPISMRWDHWCSNSTLADYVGGASLDCFTFPYLKNYISNLNGVFSNNTPQILKNAVCSFQILESDGACFLWKDCAHPKFRDFVKDFYSDLSDSNWYNFIWHKKNMLKHSVYVWLAMVGGLKTQDALRLRKIHVPVNCSLCHSAPESFVNGEILMCCWGISDYMDFSVAVACWRIFSVITLFSESWLNVYWSLLIIIWSYMDFYSSPSARACWNVHLLFAWIGDWLLFLQTHLAFLLALAYAWKNLEFESPSTIHLTLVGRFALWDQLKNFASISMGLWCVGGYFNIISNASERLGGMAKLWSKLSRLKQSEKEVWKVMQEVNIDSVASPDWFTTKFFITTWHITKGDILEAVTEFFSVKVIVFLNLVKDNWLGQGSIDSMLSSHTLVTTKLFLTDWMSTVKGHVTNLLPILILWFLWKARNEAKHDGRKMEDKSIISNVNHKLLQIYASKLISRKNFIHYETLGVYLGIPIRMEDLIRRERIVRWIKPVTPYLKLNTDGFVDNSHAGFGGILRDNVGKVIVAYADPLSLCKEGCAKRDLSDLPFLGVVCSQPDLLIRTLL
ncbi:hypothetical protein KFK09_006936 [Dendrobium nobile]|uniref:Reverse transcriptase domain-containing protein n=1 Tax=Dendrobium nobile TaxID=94219 RepID=A0A8T3BQV8_DENNO|nr:hypothetical protein KFK09_006936 [Dendrobium nobile]